MANLPLRYYLSAWKEIKQASHRWSQSQSALYCAFLTLAGLTAWLISAWPRENKDQAHSAHCFFPRAVSGTWKHSILGKEMDAWHPECKAAEGSVASAGGPFTLPVKAFHTWTSIFPFPVCVSILILALQHLNHDNLKVILEYSVPVWERTYGEILL